MGIPAGGVGNGNERQMLDTSPEKQAERSAKGNEAKAFRAAIVKRAQEMMVADGVGFLKARMRAYEELRPDEPMSPKQTETFIREALRETTPERLDVMVAVALDKSHPDFGGTSRALMDHDLGKAKQAVELANKDGSPFVINVTSDDAGML